MDVAIVTTRMIGMDAISNFTMASAAAFARNGKATVFTFAYERPQDEGVDIRFLGGRNAHSIGTSLRALLSTFGLARELSKYDVLIMANPDVGSMPACHLARRYNPKLKVMWRFHGATPPEFLSTVRERLLMRVRNLAYAWSMKRSHHVLTDSQFIKEELAHGGVDPSKISVMTLGVDLNRFLSGDRQRVRAMYGIGDEFLVLYVGRLVNFKHVDELIGAIARVNNARLLVVGGGPELPRLEAQAKSPGDDGRVKFAGRVRDEELPDYYAACDAWATASRHEGFCVPIIEAMAAGKPVIVPDVTAMPETAGDAGLVFPAGDMISLAEKVRTLSADKELYSRLSTSAKLRGATFDISHAMERYVEMVKKLCNDQRYIKPV